MADDRVRPLGGAQHAQKGLPWDSHEQAHVEPIPDIDFGSADDGCGVGCGGR